MWSKSYERCFSFNQINQRYGILITAQNTTVYLNKRVNYIGLGYIVFHHVPLWLVNQSD